MTSTRSRGIEPRVRVADLGIFSRAEVAFLTEDMTNVSGALVFDEGRDCLAPILVEVVDVQVGGCHDEFEQLLHWYAEECTLILSDAEPLAFLSERVPPDERA